MPPAGFKLAIPVSEWMQTHAIKLRGHWDQQGNDYLVLLLKLNMDNYAALNFLNYQIQHKSTSIVTVSHDHISTFVSVILSFWI